MQDVVFSRSAGAVDQLDQLFFFRSIAIKCTFAQAHFFDPWGYVLKI